MSEKILNIYRSILSYSGMGIDTDGTIYGQLTKELPKKSVVINDEPVVFPIRKQLDDQNQNKIYFHPFSENFLRGESEIIQLLRERISRRINYVTAVVGQSLLELLGSPKLHAKLNEEQASLLMSVSEADDKSVVNWSKLMMSLIKTNADSAYVKLYLKRSGTWKGESYSRIGVVTFPFYQDLANDKYEGLRVKDRIAFKKIFEFIFPDIKQSEAYNYGTRGNIAPYFEALMRTSANVVERLNTVIQTFEPFIDGSEELMFDAEWFQDFENLNNLREDLRLMPELRGNAGVSSVQERTHPGQEIKSEIKLPAPPTLQPVNQGVAVNYQANTPAMAATTPMMVPQQEVPSITTPDGKIKFGEVLRHNPMLAATPNPTAMAAYPPQVQAYVQQYGVFPPGYGPTPATMQRTPGWAAPATPVMNPYGQPLMQGPVVGYPQGYPQPGYQIAQAPVMPPAPNWAPPAGTMWAFDPTTGQWVTVPVQGNYPQQQPNIGGMPGWSPIR